MDAEVLRAELLAVLSERCGEELARDVVSRIAATDGLRGLRMLAAAVRGGIVEDAGTTGKEEQ